MIKSIFPLGEIALHVYKALLADLWQLSCYVTADKHSLQVDPEILDLEPVLNDVGCVTQLMHPGLNLRLEWRVVPA